MNKVQLIGRLTKDPDLRYTKLNIAVASYTIAINTGYGEKQQTDYINISSWGKSGEFVSNYFKKGQAIALVGRLRNNNYEDSNGNKRYTVEVITEDIEFVGSKNEKQNGQDEEIEKEQSISSEYQSNLILTDDDLPF